MADIAPAQDMNDNLVELFGRHGPKLRSALYQHSSALFPPNAVKPIRRFTTAEVAHFLGISDAYLRQLALDGAASNEAPVGAKRSFSVPEMNELRRVLDEKNKAAKHIKSRNYVPHRREGEAMQVISTINFKGGSAKTTTAVHLAQYLALRGFRVLAVDLDPQASMTTMFGVQPEVLVGERQSLLGAITYNEPSTVAELVRGTNIENLHLIPANLELAEFEHESALVMARGKISRSEAFYTRISNALAQLDEHYDIVVMDCPPQLGFLSMAALTASTSVLVTIHPSMLDVMSMGQFLTMTESFMAGIQEAGIKMDYNFIRYLITRYEPGDNPQSQMRDYLMSMFGSHVLKTPVLKSTAISDAGVLQQTLYELERSHFSRGTYDRAMESVNSVNAEVEALINAVWKRQN